MLLTVACLILWVTFLFVCGRWIFNRRETRRIIDRRIEGFVLRLEPSEPLFGDLSAARTRQLRLIENTHLELPILNSTQSSSMRTARTNDKTLTF